jgi:hypothetical protein
LSALVLAKRRRGVNEPSQGRKRAGAILTPSLDAGTLSGMDELRKITVEVPDELLRSAQSFTGEGVTETVRQGLRQLASARAQKELLAMRGKVKFSMSWQEMKGDDE